MAEEVTWSANRMSKGQFMTKETTHGSMTIEKVDRVIDPYLASVIVDGIVSYTGLHPTLSDARRTCEENANIPHHTFRGAGSY